MVKWRQELIYTCIYINTNYIFVSIVKYDMFLTVFMKYTPLLIMLLFISTHSEISLVQKLSLHTSIIKPACLELVVSLY